MYSSSPVSVFRRRRYQSVPDTIANQLFPSYISDFIIPKLAGKLILLPPKGNGVSLSTYESLVRQ